MAKQINARAFTIGTNIFFASGESESTTRTGMRLLAHEVAHTLQTGRGATQPTINRAVGEEVNIIELGDEVVSLMTEVDTFVRDSLIPEIRTLAPDIMRPLDWRLGRLRKAKKALLGEDVPTPPVIARAIQETLYVLASAAATMKEAFERESNEELRDALANVFDDDAQALTRLAGRLKKQTIKAEKEAQIRGVIEMSNQLLSISQVSDEALAGALNILADAPRMGTSESLSERADEARQTIETELRDRALASTTADGFDADAEYERVLRRGGDDPLATADALVDIVLGSENPNTIILDRVLNYHYDKSYEFKSTLVMSVVRRWSEPDRSWWNMAEGYASHNPNITFSVPLVPYFASDVLIHEADGDPIVLANRSLWYVRNNHARAEELLWMVRSKASYSDGELDEDFDRKFVLEVVSKWAEPSIEFRKLQAGYIGGESIDALRVENVFYAALDEEGVNLDETFMGQGAAFIGADTSAIAREDLDEYLHSLPEQERRELAKVVIARFSNSKQLEALASAPDTRRALATLGQSLGKLTGSQHGAVWATGLDPTGLLEEYAMLETDQKFEQQFLLKIVKAMAKTDKPHYVIPGADGSWGREINVTTKVDGAISVFLNGDHAHYAKDRPYFQSHPLRAFYEMRPERNVDVVYPGGRTVRVPAFWLVRLSELSAQQAVKTGVMVGSFVIGVEEAAFYGGVKLYKGAKSATTALTKGERALDATEDVISQLDDLAALQRGVDAADDVPGAGKALSPNEVVEFGTAAEFKVAGETHHIYFGRSVGGKIELQLCSKNCAALRDKVAAMIKTLPEGHPAREELTQILAAAEKVLKELDAKTLTLAAADARAKVLAKQLEGLAKKYPDYIDPNIASFKTAQNPKGTLRLWVSGTISRAIPKLGWGGRWRLAKELSQSSQPWTFMESAAVVEKVGVPPALTTADTERAVRMLSYEVRGLEAPAMTLDEAMEILTTGGKLDVERLLDALGEDDVMKLASLIRANPSNAAFAQQYRIRGVRALIEAEGDAARALKIMESRVEVATINGKHFAPTHTVEGFHGTNEIAPDVAFKEGLPARGTNVDLIDHVDGLKGDSAFRGTTAQPFTPDGKQGAGQWAGEGGWVYEIDGMPGWDVNHLLQGRRQVAGGMGGYGDNLMRGELETAIPAGVPPERIKGAWQVREVRGRLVLDLKSRIENPNYKAI